VGPGIPALLDIATALTRARQTVYLRIIEMYAWMEVFLWSGSSQNLNIRIKKATLKE
jgi:hypothetical protein